MPVPLPLAVAAVVLATVAGAAVGALTRLWLGRLARGTRIPPPWCEAGTGLVWGAATSAWAGGAVPGSGVGLLLGLGWLVVACSGVDVAVLRLPDALTLPAVPGVLALLIPLGGAAVLRGAVGGAVLWLVYALVRRCAPSAMGGGDVKLAGSVGAALAGLSWSAVAIGTVLAAVLTAALGTAIRVATAGIRRSRPAAAAGAPATPGTRAVPHGPSMLLACLITVTAAAGWPGPAGVG